MAAIRLVHEVARAEVLECGVVILRVLVEDPEWGILPAQEAVRVAVLEWGKVEVTLRVRVVVPAVVVLAVGAAVDRAVAVVAGHAAEALAGK